MAEEGSAKSVLLTELKAMQALNEPRGRENPDEFGTDFYQGMTTVFFNKEGDVRMVKGAVEMKKAIDEGFIFTRDDADKFPAPRIKIDDGKIFKRTDGILDAFLDGFGDPLGGLADTEKEALAYIRQQEALNKLSPNYDPLVSSAAGYGAYVIPRSETAKNLAERLLGGMDIQVRYNEDEDNRLPKPKPTLGEILMKQGE
jgi:hypothetical protein